MIKLMRRYSVAKGLPIFHKGDQARNFFIMSSGQVLVQAENNPKILEKGACFGELALIYQAPRSVTCIAIEDVVMWGI